MKMYTWRGARMSDGVEITEHARLGMSLVLGVRGRGRYEEVIKLDSRDPAEVSDGRCEFADIVEFRVGDVTRFSLRRERAHDPKRVAIRVNTAGPYTRGCSGRIDPYWGAPRKILSGHDAWGDAGRIGTLPDQLWVLSPRDALVVVQAGGSKGTGTSAVFVDDHGAPRTMPVEDWRLEHLPLLRDALTDDELASAIEAARGRGQNGLVSALAENPQETVL